MAAKVAPSSKLKRRGCRGAHWVPSGVGEHGGSVIYQSRRRELVALAAYYRVSGPDQSIEAQRHAMLSAADAEQFHEEFTDEGVTGRTHRGKASLGRPKAHDPQAVAQWRAEHGASIATTAQHFGCSLTTVKRACLASALAL